MLPRRDLPQNKRPTQTEREGLEKKYPKQIEKKKIEREKTEVQREKW